MSPQKKIVEPFPDPSDVEKSLGDKTEQSPPRDDESGEDSSSQPRSRARWIILWVGGALALLVVFAPSAITLLRHSASAVYLKRAAQEYLQDEISTSLTFVEKAVAWLPDDPVPLYRRGWIKLQAGDLTGSLDDFNDVLKLSPHFAAGYAARADVLQRLERHREALADIDKAVNLFPRDHAEILNQRAYARALANTELEKGLKDIELAMQLSHTEPVSHFLDTKGFLHHLLGDQEQALADFEKAISLQHEKLGQMEKESRKITPAAQQRRLEHDLKLELARQSLGVMLHHRSLVYEKLGDPARAEQDQKKAEEFGYDPAKGVY